jgi:hypothetical protein
MKARWATTTLDPGFIAIERITAFAQERIYRMRMMLLSKLHDLRAQGAQISYRGDGNVLPR